MPKRKRKDITLAEEIYEWIENKIKEGVFFNFSHACEYALRRLKEEMDKEKS